MGRNNGNMSMVINKSVICIPLYDIIKGIIVALLIFVGSFGRQKGKLSYS